MKKITLLALLLFMTSLGYSQLNEGFEAAPATPDATGVWTLGSGNWLVRDNRTQGTPNWEVNPAIYPANTGSKAAYINRENTGQDVLSEEWLITPQQNLGTNRQLRFFTRQTLPGQVGTGTLYQVRVSNDPIQGNLTAYTVLAQYTETELSTITDDQMDYEEKIINLGFSGQRYIAFVKVFTQPGTATAGDRWLIDDVKIVERCPEPTTLGIADVSAYNATFTWVSSALQFTIEWGPSGFVPGTGTIITGVTGNSYTVPLETTPPGPMAPDTAYQFYVTAFCSESQSLITGPFNVTTAPLGSTCDGPIVVTPLPYFDTGNTIQQGNNISFPSPGATGCGTTGNYLGGNDAVYAYTVPAITTGIISIEMNPLGATDTGVFVYNNCASIGTNCIAGVGNGSANVRSIPALAVNPGETIYIVVSSTPNTENFPYNITIQEVNCTPPSGLSAVGTGPTSANLSWQNPAGSSQWEVFVQTVPGGLPLGAGIPVSTNTGVSVTEVTGTAAPLALGTPYQFWVRADCGNGTFSPWAGPYAFNTTSCAIGCNYTFDLTDSFGDGWNGNTMAINQNGLTVATIGANFTTGAGPVTVSVPLCDGPFEIFWNAGGSFGGEVGFTVTNSFGQVIFVKEPFFGNQNSVLFSGVVDCLNPLCLPPTNLVATNVGTNGATLNWVPNGPAPVSWEIFAVQTGGAVPDATTVPNYTTNLAPPFVITTGLLADTEYEFYVRAICTVPGTNNWSVPSDAFMTLPTCPKPTNLVTSNPSQTTITFDWTAGQTETAWQYIVVPAGTTVPPITDAAWVQTSSHPVTITTGLASGTSYDFYVVAICSASDSSTIAGPLNSNTTICPPSDQCLYTFTLTDQFGDGWSGNSFDILQNGIVVATIGSNFTTGAGPIIEQVALCNGVNFEIFWNLGGNFGFEVGLAVTSFLGTPIYTKPFGVGEQGTTLYSGTAQCSAPTCLAPTAVTVISSGLDYVTVQWNENNVPSSGSWDIIVQDASLPAPAQNVTGWTNVNTNPYTFQPLNAATAYKVYVRSVCATTDKSFWSQGVSFSTTLCAASNVCEYTFNMIDVFGDGWNGNTMNVIQGGVVVAVLTGPTFQEGQNPLSQVVSLCNNTDFELYWNLGGAFPTEVGISIVNAAGTQVFVKAPGIGSPGTSLFTGTVTCVPATCPKPNQLYAIDVTETSASLGWTEVGAATSWEIFIVNSGAPAPLPGSVGIQTNNNPYTATLTSGTAYQFYVRAICATDDVSNWSGPKNFATLITNDECDSAIVVPVNGNQSCAQFVSGTIIGATASALPNDCFGTADDDVWFQFTAVTTAHNINLTNVAGSTTDLYHALYEGNNCGSLTQLYCSDDNQSIATSLTPGQTYFVRVYSWTATPGQTSTFDICIGTIPPPITSSTTTYTPVQLVEDILLNSTCASVTNITYSTGTNFGSTNGIGYFERNGSTFPFDNGVVLTSGDANNVPGPNFDTLSDGDFLWPGDADLDQVLTSQGITGTLGNATKLEFDFIPLTNNISFDFIFASEEYGTFQCSYSDVFAFLLTDMTTGITTNLAVLPGTTIPISVTTIRDELYNGDCASANPQYFSAFYQDPPGLNPLAAPINFNGVTVPLTASSPVVAGTQYHIKLAIADFGPFGQDSALDSAVFLKGGSFGIGNIELGDNLLQANGNAICAGDSVVINSTLDPTLYTFTWLQGTVVIPGETGPSLTVTQEGQYTVQAQLNNSTCTGTDTITVEYYDPIVPGQAADIAICNASSTATFDLTQAAPAILAPLGTNYTLTYFTTLADATENVLANAITTPAAYTNTSNPQVIYVRVQSNLGGCFEVTSFQLLLQDLTPQFTLPTTVSFCAGSTPTIAVTPINFDLSEATYTWTFNTNPLPDTSSSIVVSQAGFYEVTVNRNGCTATLGVNVTEVSQITPTFDPIGNVCQNSAVIELPTTSTNGVPGTWSPIAIDPAVSGTSEYCFTPDASQDCAVTICINVTVSPEIIPVFNTIPTLCVGTLAPILPLVSNNGVTGTWDGVIITTQPNVTTITFTPDGDQVCTLPVTITVTVLPAGQVPVFTQIAPICSGVTAPILPTVSNNGITGAWNSIVNNQSTTTYTFNPDAGQCAVSTTMTITVFPTIAPGFEPIPDICYGGAAPSLETTSPTGITGTWSPATVSNTQSGTYVFTPANNGQCSSVQSLSVTITSQPEFTIKGDCIGNDYVLTALAMGGFAENAIFEWTDSEGNALPADGPTVIVTSTGTYYLAISNGGCASSEEVIVTTISCGIQKGISPGDGNDNDFFDLAGLDVRKLEIFNRYGTKVYSQVNYSREWFGQSDKGDELPDGTYFYVIERENIATKTGWIYINRVK